MLGLHTMIASTIMPPDVLELIRIVAERLPSMERQILLHQADRATVCDEVPGRVIDVLVLESEPLLPLADGPIDAIPTVVDESGNIVGELLIWLASGLLVGVERPWYTEAPPDEWPDASRLRFQKSDLSEPVPPASHGDHQVLQTGGCIP